MTNNIRSLTSLCKLNLFPRISKGCNKTLASSLCSSSSSCVPSNNENDTDDILKDFVNRNPRNMEMLRLARKPIGHCLDTPSINFWYKLEFQRKNKCLNAYVIHHSGRKVVKASTNEIALRSQLYSMQDISAAMNLGRVIAQRCLQAGITEVHTELFKEMEHSKKLTVFLKSADEGGLYLKEPSQLREKEFYMSMKQFPACPWEVTEEDVDRLDANPPQPGPDRYFDSFKPRS